jgi:hypothetical protein
MPDLVFRGPAPYDYPATRDVYGVLLRTVNPGDVARLEQAPDIWWVPYEGPGADEGVPEPPADAPAATDQTSEAGVTGSEEN